MFLGISWLSWLICAFSVLSLIVLTWNVDPHTPAGIARLAGSVIAGIVAVLTLVNGAFLGRRVAAIEAARYPRMRRGASRRIAERIQQEVPQTVTIAGEAGDDIREVAAVLHEALLLANWHVPEEMTLGATLWNGGRGIIVCHSAAAGHAAVALMEVLRAEGLPVSYGGDSTTGKPIHIAFRRP